MMEKDNKENSTNKIQLEPNEVMRISLKKLDSAKADETYQVCAEFKGKKGVCFQALKQILEEEFDMTCIPMGDAVVIGVSLVDPSDLDDEDADDNGGEGKKS